MKMEIPISRMHPGNRLRLIAGLSLLPEEPIKLPLPTYTAPGSCPHCSAKIPGWWVRDYCANCGEEIPQAGQQAEAVEMEGDQAKTA